MTRVIIAPFKMGSQSATAISKHFGEKKVFKDRRFSPRTTDILINWGHTDTIPVFEARQNDVMNSPERVQICTSKTDTYRALANSAVNVPIYFTTAGPTADYMRENPSAKVFCRTLTRASQGRGIVIATDAMELASAPLYTVKVPHTNEYRVHVMGGRVIDIVEKRRMNTATLEERNITLDEDIKSHDKGWVFVHGSARLKHLDGQFKTDLATQALRAMNAIGLDFGAVDVVYNNPERKATVIEVNSSPGMEEGTTTHFNWTNAFARIAERTELSKAQYEAKYNQYEELGTFENVTEYINSL